MVYEFAGATLILIAVNSAIMAIGSWNWHARMCGGCCFCLLGIINLAAIIVTAVFRFNLLG